MEDIRTLKSPPKVGQIYLVPRLHIDHREWRDYAAPVLCERPQEDPEIGNPIPHYHVDYRFANLELLNDRIFFSINSWYKRDALALRADIHPVEVRIEPTECLRDFPDAEWGVRGSNRDELLKDVKGKKLSLQCLKCPHKGTYIGNAPRDANGDFWCPAHGLKFDKATGEVLT